MPLFNNFPYTNFHQMNLDFILKKVRIIDDLDSTVNELTGKYNDVFNKVDELTKLYDSFASDIRADLDEWQSAADANIQRQLNAVRSELLHITAEQNTLITALGSRVSTMEQTLTQTTYMESPFTGEIVPIQQVIRELAALHTTDALTAAEYDAADLTAQAYDALQLTAYQYDWNGSQYIN